MALTRRSTQRMNGAIWPGFVDAMTALLLVLMFVLTIFMIVQFILRETISGQAHELDELAAQVSGLAETLGLERTRADALKTEVGSLTATLAQARTTADAQAAVIAQLSSQAETQAARISSFEEQVATLLSERDAARLKGSELAANIADLEAANSRLVTEQEALQLALVAARNEVDAGAEQARLAAAKREALEALIASLEQDVSDKNTALSELEAGRLAEAAAAQALQDKLKNSSAELTAMTLALEAQRQRAEETLTLLAAAKAAEEELDNRLAATVLELDELKIEGRSADELSEKLKEALAARLAAETQVNTVMSDAEQSKRLLALANLALSQEEAASAESQRKVALLNEQMAALRAQLGGLQSILDDSALKDETAQVQIQQLGSQLNAALARVASEERKRAALEAAERERLESYRSEFFGKLREVLGDREGVQIVGDRFIFSSEVLFTSGDAVLQPGGETQVANVARLLTDVAGEIPDGIDWIIRVDGHTDNIPLLGTGEFRNNWELSQARALSVVEFMIDELGFPPQRLAATGFGEFRPVASGQSAAARAQNRRIELKLTER